MKIEIRQVPQFEDKVDVVCPRDTLISEPGALLEMKTKKTTESEGLKCNRPASYDLKDTYMNCMVIIIKRQSS